VRFIDLFAGLGGFPQALTSLGHECVFASDIDEQLANLYYKNFGIEPHGDIRDTYKLVPKHDILCVQHAVAVGTLIPVTLNLGTMTA
jgi:DNA (cytosine-5)-methyltransferase 1